MAGQKIDLCDFEKSRHFEENAAEIYSVKAKSSIGKLNLYGICDNKEPNWLSCLCSKLNYTYIYISIIRNILYLQPHVCNALGQY